MGLKVLVIFDLINQKFCARLFELVHLVRGGADVEEDDLRVAVDEPPPAVDPVATLPKLLHRLT